MDMSLNLVMADDPLAELNSLAATLEQALEDFPGLRLQLPNLLFAGGDDSLKPGLVELVAVPADGAGGPAVIHLQATDRLREIVAAAVANELEHLRVD
jgi:hypothetical protein